MHKIQYEFKPLAGVTSKLEQWAWWDNAFTEEELDLLQDLAKKSSEIAQVGEKVENLDVRRTRISWLDYSEDNSWVFERLESVVQQVNKQYFNFKLDGFGEPFQLAEYDSEVKGHYEWHSDASKGYIRKLSCSLQLTDPEEYTGGDLQLMLSGNITDVKKKRGLITFFPSWTVHRVTPVLTGSRQSLVSWITGPDFC